MKKLFAEPTMDIKSFEAENILTLSGTEQAEGTTAEQLAATTNGVITVDAINDLHIVF